MPTRAQALSSSHPLQAAFEQFNAVSDQLIASYQQLELQVSVLNAQLEKANQALAEQMSANTALAERLARQEKLAAMGEMAASLAHQLRTPLTSALLFTANLKKNDLSHEERLRLLEKAIASLGALEGLIQNTLGFVRDPVMVLEELPLRIIVDDLVTVFAPQCQAKNIVFGYTEIALSAIKMRVDKKALISALSNLLDNALYFSPANSQIDLCISQRPGWVCLVVKDRGPGFAPAQMKRVFEPFYTTRSGGTGLGLAVVYQVASALGGQVSCRNRTAGGACVELLIPVSEVRDQVSGIRGGNHAARDVFC